MATMTAFRMVRWGAPPEYQEVEIPKPGPGQVLVRMAGAGLCRTDLHILHSPPGIWGDVPFTLGHENAGRIAEVGEGVTGVAVDDGVIVSGVNFCGHCDTCVRGLQNECRHLQMSGYGTGDDGGLAEYLLAEARHVVRLGELDPVRAAPLADAGSTSYHAVKRALPVLLPGSTAVVIGVGGLGSYAVQYLRQLTGVRIVAVDTEKGRLETARHLGAHEAVVSGPSAAEEIKDLVHGPVEAVLDFVGATPTLELAVSLIGLGGRVLVAGIGGGEIPMGWEKLPMNAEFINTTGFTVGDLNEVVALAAAGRIELTSTPFAFDRIEEGLEALGKATVVGRAVVTFD